MYKRICVKRLERITIADGSTLHFRIPGVDRRHLACFLTPDEVPPFEGDVAYFEMEWRRKGVWMGYTILRQVEPTPDRLAEDNRRSDLPQYRGY